MAVRVSLRRRGCRRHGFGLLELVVVLLVLAVVVAVVLPMLGSARRNSRRFQFGNPVRGIHQASVMWAQSNGGYFPGADTRGDVLPAAAIDGADVPGSHPAARYVLLMAGNYFTGEYAISPVESGKTEWTTTATPITPDQFSFAMLGIDLDDDGVSDRFPGTGPTGQAGPEAGEDSGDTQRLPLNHRVAEWSETLNTEAPMIGDRNIGSDADADVGSIHTRGERGRWRGSVVYNDNHVVFEPTPSVTTRFGDGPLIDADNLFASDTPEAASDAAWVFHDASSLVDQK